MPLPFTISKLISMSKNQDEINRLLERQDKLYNSLKKIAKEVVALKEEINYLKSGASVSRKPKEKLEPIPEHKLQSSDFEAREKVQRPALERQEKKVAMEAEVPGLSSPFQEGFEKFVGENLISKIGIIILIIGVVIGAKYSIDNNLIQPLTRIVMGYMAGIGLLGFGMKLKEKYEKFSAVLVSGAMAVLYFITYAAYDFYGLIPQMLAFLLMVVFTAFTVFAAIQYKRSVIAYIGLVGAYAVPFLLSSGSGQYAVLFAYVAIINIGILVVAFKQDWRKLNYLAFFFTWLIYGGWLIDRYFRTDDFTLAIGFATLFFLIFYTTFLAYKLLRKEQFVKGDIVLLFLNSFLYFGIGFYLLEDHPIGKQVLGLFTLANAVLHFIVSYIIYKQDLVDKKVQYLVSGLVLTFITLAVPIQLDGNWVTLFWIAEAAILFWLGRTKNIAFYEKVSYVLMALAIGSLAQDWTENYGTYHKSNPESWIRPILNINFLTSVLFMAAFGFIYYLNQKEEYKSPINADNGLVRLLGIAIPVVLFLGVFASFALEIGNYWGQLYLDSYTSIPRESGSGDRSFYNHDLLQYNTVWLVNYTLLFLSVFSLLNLKIWKKEEVGFINLMLNGLGLFLFLVVGLFAVSELRDSYMDETLIEYYDRGIFNILIRYVSLIFAVALMVITYQYKKADFLKTDLGMIFEIALATVVIWFASSELIHWMDMAESEQSYKLALSILWGICSLILIGIGIYKQKKHLRIMALALFAGTLAKLFLYDISHLTTIGKTIVFVSLGVLLLVISFLYNKFKDEISGEEQMEEVEQIEE